MLLLDIVSIDGDGKSEYPVGEAEDIIIELQWLFEVLVRDTISFREGLLWIV